MHSTKHFFLFQCQTLQITATTMGITFAPNYANLVMAVQIYEQSKFEIRLLNFNKYLLDERKRYLDDYLNIWTTTNSCNSRH